MMAFQIIAGFWRDFAREPFYETGFADAVEQSGAAGPADANELIGALSYLQGYSDCAKLLCPYLGVQWRIAHAIGCYASVFRLRLIRGRNEGGMTAAHAERLVQSFTAELTGLVQDKRERGAA